MASGKSSIGRLLARKLRRRFIDTDRLVIEHERRDIPEIFEADGEDYFRSVETRMLDSLTESSGLVVATGGGIVTQPRNLEILERLGFVVWLCTSEDTIFERVSRNQNRPLLRTPDPRATIRELYGQRAPLYEAASQMAVNTSTLAHRDIADAIITEANRRFSCKAES